MNKNSYFCTKKLLQLNHFKTAFNILVVVAGALLALLLLTLCCYNHPTADDFVYAVNVQQYGFVGAQIYWYVHWCGRYFSTLLLSMSPLVIGSFAGYKLMSALLIMLSLASFYFFIKMIFHLSSWLEKLYFVFLTFISFILLMPSVAEAYYWMAGAYSYQMGNILTLVLVMLMLHYTEKPSKRKLLLSIIVAIVLVGTNEFSMFVLVLMLLFINLLMWIRTKKFHTYYIVLAIVAIGFSLVVYLAPGNTYRASFQSQNHQLWFSLKSAIAESFDVLHHWWWIVGFIAFTSYSLASRTLKKDKNPRFESIYLNPFVVAALIWITIALGFFTCYWSLGLYPPMRTINTIYFYCIIGSIYLGICIAFKLKQTKISNIDVSLGAWLIPLLLMLYIYKYPNNIKTAYLDIFKGVAQRYDSELTERYKSLQTNTNHHGSITKLKNIPKTLYFKDISENTDITMLRNYEVYFNKDSISVE